jgi:hypothetical protein
MVADGGSHLTGTVRTPELQQETSTKCLWWLLLGFLPYREEQRVAGSPGEPPQGHGYSWWADPEESCADLHCCSCTLLDNLSTALAISKILESPEVAWACPQIPSPHGRLPSAPAHSI